MVLGLVETGVQDLVLLVLDLLCDNHLLLGHPGHFLLLLSQHGAKICVELLLYH